MNIELNPFLNLSIYELEIAYVNFTHVNDVEAVAWVVDAFCLKAVLELN